MNKGNKIDEAKFIAEIAKQQIEITTPVLMVSGHYVNCNVAMVPSSVLIAWLLKLNENPNRDAITKRNLNYARLEHYIRSHHETIFIEFIRLTERQKRIIQQLIFNKY